MRRWRFTTAAASWFTATTATAKSRVQVVDPFYIDELVSMMHQVVEQGTGRRAQLPGIEVAGKTGTTNDYKDAWFCGYTGNFVGVVWYGNDDGDPMNKVTGGTLPAGDLA